jgi:ABC-type sugar transport system permease subunit
MKLSLFLLIAITVVPFLIGLIAALLIPSKVRIQRNCITVMRSRKKSLVYIIGFFLLSIGIVILILLFEDIIQYDVAYLLNMIFYISVGAGLIIENFRKHRYARAIIRTAQQYQYVREIQ